MESLPVRLPVCDRAGFVPAGINCSSRSTAPPGDQADYLRLADNLRTHAVLGAGNTPKAHRPPLYPVILALLGTTGTEILQLIAGSAIAPLTFAIASPLLAPAEAMMVGLAMALAPMSSRFCALSMAETLFTYTLVLGAFFWMLRKPVLCGICFGLAALMRAVLFPMLVLLPLLAIKRSWRSSVIISATALAVVLPWGIRNAVVHQYVPIAGAGWGSNLFQGTLDVPEGNPWPFIMQQRAGDMEGALLKRGTSPHSQGEPWAMADGTSQTVPQALSRRRRVHFTLAQAAVLGW